MAVKSRLIDADSKEDLFCGSCLNHHRKGLKKLVQIRIRTHGSVFDTFYCEKCAKEIADSIKEVLK